MGMDMRLYLCLHRRVPMEISADRVAVITLRPAERTASRKKVVWTEDTVDNEHMNKKKSKCCCIYEKPRKFDESDSESSDDECEHCFGHVEHKRHRAGAAAALEECVAPSAVLVLQPPATEPPATLVLQPPATEPPATEPPDGAPGDTVDGN